MQRLSIAELEARWRQGQLKGGRLRDLATDPRRGAQKLWRRVQQQKEQDRQERRRLRRLTRNERRSWQQGLIYVAGVDEVGAGPLAGPVVAAAVVMPPECLLPGVDDSKKLTAVQRQRLAAAIQKHALAVGLGSCSPREIERFNILQASRQAMLRAVKELAVEPQFLLVDAREIPDVQIPQVSLVDGDAISYSIAAASIVAKVARDAYMDRAAKRYPGYGFCSNRGYGTAEHLAALQKKGPTPLHRRTFAPVRVCLERASSRVV